MDKKPKRPVGRPTKYRAAMLDEVSTLGNNGESFTEMSVKLGVYKETLRIWMEKNPALSIAIKEALARSQSWWEEKGRELAFEGKGNGAAFIFQMKNRFREDYRDKVEQEVTGKNGTPIDPEPLSRILSKETLQKVREEIYGIFEPDE